MDLRPGLPLACLQRGFGLFHDLVECARVADRNVGQHFAVETYAGLGKAMDEASVRDPARSRSSIDPLDPETAEVPLAGPAIAVGVLEILLDPLDGCPESVLLATACALSRLQNLAVAAACGHACRDSRHGGSPASAVPEQVAFDEPPVRRGSDTASARIANELAGALDHAVALSGMVTAHLTGRGQAKPLLSGAFTLDLWHVGEPWAVARESHALYNRLSPNPQRPPKTQSLQRV